MFIFIYGIILYFRLNCSSWPRWFRTIKMNSLQTHLFNYCRTGKDSRFFFIHFVKKINNNIFEGFRFSMYSIICIYIISDTNLTRYPARYSIGSVGLSRAKLANPCPSQNTLINKPTRIATIVSFHYIIKQLRR